MNAFENCGFVKQFRHEYGSLTKAFRISARETESF